MKETVISAERKKKELKIILWCFITANLINIGAIAYFKTRWIEVISQLGYVMVLTAIFYVFIFLIRWIFSVINKKR